MDEGAYFCIDVDDVRVPQPLQMSAVHQRGGHLGQALSSQAESEGFDRTHLDLPLNQSALLDAVVAANRRVVVVLSNGGVLALADLAAQVPTVLELWLGGQASGSAAADLLFGATEPGGRLAETIPLALTDTPAHVNRPGTDSRVLYGERIHVGYRWYDSTDLQSSVPDPLRSWRRR